MKLFKTTLIATALIAAGFVGNADAASKSTTFKVKIKITESCQFSSSATDVNFGSVNRSAAIDTQATGNLYVTCTNGTPYQIGLNEGLNGLSVSDRKMMKVGSTETISYGLYLDNARTENWGNTTDTDTFSDTSNGLQQTVPVYGKVLVAGNVSAGNYSDTIRATITY